MIDSPAGSRWAARQASRCLRSQNRCPRSGWSRGVGHRSDRIDQYLSEERTPGVTAKSQWPGCGFRGVGRRSRRWSTQPGPAYKTAGACAGRPNGTTSMDLIIPSCTSETNLLLSAHLAGPAANRSGMRSIPASHRRTPPWKRGSSSHSRLMARPSIITATSASSMREARPSGGTP